MLDRYRLQIGLSALALIIITLGIIIGQDSCGKKHETNAATTGTIADVKHDELKPLLEKIEAGKLDVAKMQVEADKWKAKYLASRSSVGLPTVTESTVPTPSADTIPLTFGEEGLLAAVANCDAALRAEEDVAKALRATLGTTEQALTISQQEAQARAEQAKELGKALKVEKAKGWQRIAYGVAGAAVVFLVKK